MKQYHLYFSGKVQGVWFRRTSRNYARELGLKGWVKNLSDGRVEMVAEGPENLIQVLMAQLKQDFEIGAVEEQIAAPSEEFPDFYIEY